jgi:hypothetical protein
MKRLLLTLVVCALVGAGAAAQTSPTLPNFAGTWTLQGDAGGGPFTPASMVVVQDAKTLSVTASGQMGDFKTVYNLDGTDAKSPLEFNGNAIDRTTRAKWEGGKLVMTVSSDFGGQAFETKSVWSLGADGVLTVESTVPDFQGGGAPVTTTVTYKKS